MRAVSGKHGSGGSRSGKYTVFPTEAGWMGLVSNDKGICASVLPRKTETEARDRLFSLAGFIPDFSGSAFKDLERLLQAYFRGEEVCFNCNLDWAWATPFQKRVLETTALIPRGAFMTYGELASRIGIPKGARAVGGALAANRIPVIIPCHRVIGAKGRLGGFTGAGLQLKAHMLGMEGVKLNLSSLTPESK